MSTRSSLIGGAEIPPAGTAGLVSRYLISWVLPLLWRGYKQPLGMDHLGSIDRELYSYASWSRLSPSWESQRMRHAEGKTTQPLLWACLRAFGNMLATPILPALIYTVVSVARPLIILHVINFVENTGANAATGWGLVGATFLTYAVYALALALSEIAVQRAGLALRGAFMECLYRKSLVMRVETAREMGSAKAGNLMSVDVQNVVEVVPAVHDMWTALLTTGLGLYIIYTQIGLSFVGSSFSFPSLLIGLACQRRGSGTLLPHPTPAHQADRTYSR